MELGYALRAKKRWRPFIRPIAKRDGENSETPRSESKQEKSQGSYRQEEQKGRKIKVPQTG